MNKIIQSGLGVLLFVSVAGGLCAQNPKSSPKKIREEMLVQPNDSLLTEDERAFKIKFLELIVNHVRLENDTLKLDIPKRELRKNKISKSYYLRALSDIHRVNTFFIQTDRMSIAERQKWVNEFISEGRKLVNDKQQVKKYRESPAMQSRHRNWDDLTAFFDFSAETRAIIFPTI